MFTEIGPEHAPDHHAVQAGRLLVASAHGDRLAHDVVEAVTERCDSLRAFADDLRRWAWLDTLPTRGAAPPPPESFELAAADPRLVGALIRRNATATLARGMVDGHNTSLLMDAATQAGCASELVAGLGSELRGLSRLDAWAALQRLEQALPSHAPGIASMLADAWLGLGHLGALQSDDAVALARLLARSRTRRTDSAVRELLTSPHATRALVEDVELPGSWRD